MKAQDDPFATLVLESDEFAALSRKPVAAAQPGPLSTPGAVTARFHGFGLDERPLVVGVPGLAHEVLPARATVALRRRDTGAEVVLLFEGGDLRRPIVVGVIQDRQQPAAEAAIETSAPAPLVAPLITVQADDDRFVVTAEREIVLRCGEASITLTRAGKVIIKGSHIVSGSSGYNKIKGAVVDIN